MDYFKFTCPHCQTRIGTSPDTSGHTVNCPSCHGDVIIPPAPANEGDVVPGIAPATTEAKDDHEAAEHTMMLRKSDLEDKPSSDGTVDQFDGPKVPDMGALDDDNPFGAPAAEDKPAEKPAAAVSDTPAKADPFDGPTAPDMSKLDGGDNPFGGAAEESKPAEKPAETPKPEEKKEEPKPAPAPEPKPEEKAEDKPAEAPAPTAPEPEVKKKPEPQRELVSSLTTEVKVALVKQARAHIAEESTWIHGRSGPGGKVVLAAKKSGDTVVPLKPGSSEATHYSIVGALLVTMDEMNVKATAAGRSEFLHYEIEDATRSVTGKARDEKVDPMNLSHTQCVEALDYLQQKYRKTLGDDDFADLFSGKTSSRGSTGLEELIALDDDALDLKEVMKAINEEFKSLTRRIEELEGNSEE